MKKILLSISCLLAAVLANAQAPTFEWAKNMGGYYGYAAGTSNAIDASGNIYTTGYFEGRIDFDPGVNVSYLTSAGLYDIFITKTDAAGNFLWAKQLGGTADDRGNSIVVNSAGNIIVIGNFTGTADFDPGAAIYNLISTGFDDIFISMIDASGNFSWARQIGGTKVESGNAIAIDAANNIYTTGYFEWIVDFDPGAGNFTLIGGGSTPNVFISKLNSNGDFVWAKQMEGGISKGESIAIDPSGNIYTVGTFTSTTDFDPGTGTFNLTGAGSPDMFISKLNASGNFLWAKHYGGSVQYDPGSIKTDASGNMYIAGSFTGTSDFDPGPAIFNLTSAGIFDFFISKLDASGNFIWANRVGGSNSSDIANSISLDGTGNIYATGYFGSTVDFDPGPGTFNLTSTGGGAIVDIFIYKLNNSGNFVWAKAVGGSANDYATSVAVNAAGNVFTTGYFYNTVDFDPGPGTYNLVALGANSLFTLNLDVSGNFIWAKSAGAGASTFAKAMTTDLSGNVYSTGYFYGIIDFDPGPGIFNLTSGATDIYGDVFITKCDASGNLIWAKQIGGTLRDYGSSIAVDAAGNVYTAGFFNQTADFDPGAGIFNLTGSDDSFISKLDASGNFVWATKINSSSNASMYSIALDASGNIFTAGMDAPGTNSFQIFLNKIDPLGNLTWSKTYGGTSYDGANAITTDASGNIYITGYFSGTVDFDPNTGMYNMTAVGGKDIFISKLDGSGNFIWAKQIGGVQDDMGTAIAVDASGKVNVGGTFLQTVDFDPGPGTANMTSTSYEDIFITQLENSGNFTWAKQFAGGSTDNLRSIKLDNSGNVYTTGRFAGTIDFDPGPGTFNLTASTFDIFISKLDVSGNYLWAQQIVGSGSYDDDGYSIALDGTGNIYTCGTFSRTADFDPGSGISNITANGDPDLFIHKLSQCILPSAIVTPSGPTTFCSGGSVMLNAPDAANRSYQWKKGANLISGATLSSYTATTGGNYKVIVTNTVTGCSKTTGSATVVTVNALPSATITPQGPTTFCAGGSVVLKANAGTGLTYKWKKGINFISGATFLNYTATTGGNYKVQVTNSNGCSKTSAGVVVSVPCREGEMFSENGFDVNVFPNPNSGEFTIKFPYKPAYPIQIELTDEIGKVVKSFETNDETVVINESNLAKGIHFLTARNRDEEVRRKISVVK